MNEAVAQFPPLEQANGETSAAFFVGQHMATVDAPVVSLPLSAGAGVVTAIRTLDLAAIDTPAMAEKGYEIELEYDGQKTGWFVAVRGEHSKSVKSWQLGVGNKFALKEWKNKRASKNDGPSLMSEEDMETGLRGAAVRIANMRGIVFGGAPFPYSEANAYELVRRHPPFADQIIEASGDLANFTIKR